MIACIFISGDFELVAVLLDGIAEKVAFPMGNAVFDLLQEQFFLHNKNIQIHIGMILLLMDLRHIAVFIHLNPQAGIMLRLKMVNLLVHQRYVSTLLQMILKYILEVGGIDVLAAGENDIFGRSPLEEIEIIVIMLQIPQGSIRRIIPVGRQNEQSAMLAVHVPRLAVAEMVHQRTVFAADKQPYTFQLRTHHVGEDKIDQPVPAGKRHSRAATEIGQLI
ncbi:hypothetical protein D3C75_701130 [compost metagenome]